MFLLIETKLHQFSKFVLIVILYFSLCLMFIYEISLGDIDLKLKKHLVKKKAGA